MASRGEVKLTATSGGCEECGKPVPAANAQLHALRCQGHLSVGCTVTYNDRSTNSLIEATVTAVDKSLRPPAYTIKLLQSGAERETERDRIQVHWPADGQS
jgi:hypothetical protein